MLRCACVLGMLLLVLPAAAADYAKVIEGAILEFPRDHGAHPAYRTEWWYVTGWLRSEEGRELGFQVTFFRVRPNPSDDNPSRFAPRQILFAHAALADPAAGHLLHDEKVARAGFELAEAKQGATRVWIDDWSLIQEGEAYRTRIEAREFSFELALSPTQPILLQGKGGFSQKATDSRHASYYYSRPHLAVSGTLRHAGRTDTVTGSAWLDHEWSSEMLPQQAVGWDWVGLNLHDGSALMAFRMRDAAGGTLWAGGTLRRRDAEPRRLRRDEIAFEPLRRWRSPRTGANYPTAMRVRAGPIEVELQPLFDDQELDSRRSVGTVYWEGAVRGLQAGREIGLGYLELTGYWTKLAM